MKKASLLFAMLCMGIAAAFAQTAEQKAFLKKEGIVGKDLNEAVKRKDYKKSEKIFLDLIDLFEKQPAKVQDSFAQAKYSYYYNLACCQALQGKKREALQNLEKAIGDGKWEYDYQNVLDDEDLNSLHGTEKFRDLMARMKETRSYLSILQKAPGYVRSERRDTLPRFTYAASDDPGLVRVRQYFKLDSVAGTGDEVSKVKNILTYIHDKIMHDGMHGNPSGGANAIDYAEACKDGSRGLNCRGLATVLNECYLSMGFKSRLVTCMPKVYVNDCHVINVVYLPSLGRWVWMDPTHNAWVMDEKGNLLGIREVRERLRDGRPLVLNKEANWNNRDNTIAEYYLYDYMAKNLYYLNCWLRNEFDTESKYGRENRINLMPTGFDTSEEPMQSLRVNDDGWFWQSPSRQ